MEFLMPLRILRVCILLFCVSSAFGAVLSIANSDTESFFANATYRFQTIGNNNPHPAHVGYYTGADYTDPYDVTSSEFSFALVNTLPAGATANSALLDLYFLLQGALSSSVTSSTPADWAYVPAFSSTASGIFITIQSGVTTHTLPVDTSSVTDLDLAPLGFVPELEAGNDLTIYWSESVRFTADNSGYGDDCKNCTKVFSVTRTPSGDAFAWLDIDYTRAGTAAIPEPASALLLAGGLTALGWRLKKRNRA
jgi:hypothetical protein